MVCASMCGSRASCGYGSAGSVCAIRRNPPWKMLGVAVGCLPSAEVRTPHVPIITYVCLVMGIYPSGVVSVPGQMTRSARRARKGGKDRNRHNDFNGLTTGREVRRMVRHTVSGKGHVLLLVLASLLVIALPAGGLAALIDEQVLRTEVAAGIDLIKIRRFDEAGWLNIFALEI